MVRFRSRNRGCEMIPGMRVVWMVAWVSVIAVNSLAAGAGDRPQARQDWNGHQRSYPYGLIFPDAYSEAAARYVAQRAESRRRLASPDFVPGANDALPGATWIEVGPAPMRNAIFSYGNVSGRISTLALHPSDPEVALAGGSAGGIWRTANASATPPTWTPVGDDLPTLAIADIEFAPSDPSIVYAASGDDDVSLWGMGVFKSNDGGLTWARVDDGTAATGIPDGTVLSKIAVHANAPDLVAAVARRYYTKAGADDASSIFVTRDGGRTWSQSTLPLGGTTGRFRELVAEPGCPDRLWAVDQAGGRIIRSLDFGATWLGIAAGGLPAFTNNTKLAVHHPSCGGAAILFASVHSGSSLAGDPALYAGVYASYDDGATWARPGAPGPSGGCLRQCSYDHEMLVDPVDPQRVYMIGRDFWRSTDGGAGWSNVSGGFSDSNGYSGGRMHVDLHAIEMRGSGAGAVLWIGGDGGIWSYDLAADRFMNRVGNLATAEFVDLAPHPDTVDLAIGGTQDNGTIMYDGSLDWPTSLHGDGASRASCDWPPARVTPTTARSPPTSTRAPITRSIAVRTGDPSPTAPRSATRPTSFTHPGSAPTTVCGTAPRACGTATGRRGATAPPGSVPTSRR